jgi:hypothetical protein
MHNPGERVKGSWEPIALFSRNDSIVSLFNILSNSVNYPGPVDDPIFLASIENHSKKDPNEIVYFGDYFATTLVCLEQFQFCNPQSGSCTAETHPKEAMALATRDIGLNKYQKDVMLRIGGTIAETSMYDSGPGSLGVSSKRVNFIIGLNSQWTAS